MFDSLLKALSDLEKAAQHKYTHKKRVGTDKKGRPQWRYFYNVRHGGGIGGAALEVKGGEAFQLTNQGQRGHFHVQRVRGNRVTVRHDETGHEVTMSKRELQALLMQEHGEKFKREKKKPAKVKREKKEPAREQSTRGANNFETMPETPATKQDPKHERLERLKRMYKPNRKKVISPEKYVISFSHKSGGDNYYLISIGDPREGGSKFVGLVQYKMGVTGWLADNKDKISEDFIVDISGLNLVSDQHTDSYMKMQEGIKNEIATLQAELDQSDRTLDRHNEILDAAIESFDSRSPSLPPELQPMMNELLDAHESGQLPASMREDSLAGSKLSMLANKYEMLSRKLSGSNQDLLAGIAEIARGLASDNFETMPESESQPEPSRAGMAPSLDEMSIEELHSERTSTRAEVDDLGTLIEERKRKRQKISEQRKLERAAQSRLNQIEAEIQNRERQSVEGGNVPSQTEIQAAVEKVRQMIELNPALANMPEVAALLGSTGSKKVELSDLPDTEMVITLQGKTQSVPVRYKIIEVGDAIASHDAGGFFKRSDYPTDVQEREYHDPRGPEQRKVISQAQNLNPQLLINTNPDAMNGPPILTAEGIALGGNSRVMSVQRAYMAHPKKAQAYKDYLRRKAHQFGLSVEDVEQFNAPLLVREYVVEDQSKENLSKLVRAMNEGLTQEFDPQGEGRAAATKLQGENVTLSAIAIALQNAPEGSTLNSVLKTKGERLEGIKRALFRDGILTSRNSNRFIHQGSGTFNDQGVSFIQRMITGYVIRDDRLMRALSPSTEDAIGTALAKLSAVGIRADDAKKLQDAILLFNGLVSKSTDNGGIHYSMKPQDRDRRMNVFMNEDVEMDFGEGGDKINLQRVKERVKADPLA
jgi:hypothetical protein